MSEDCSARAAVCRDRLRLNSAPKYIVAVTGSNGKTSTVEMIAHILCESGKKVAWNKEGSNQIEGVTTLEEYKFTAGVVKAVENSILKDRELSKK